MTINSMCARRRFTVVFLLTYICVLVVFSNLRSMIDIKTQEIISNNVNHVYKPTNQSEYDFKSIYEM